MSFAVFTVLGVVRALGLAILIYLVARRWL